MRFMVIRYDLTLDKAVNEIGLSNETTFYRSHITSQSDPNQILEELLSFRSSLKTGFTAVFVLHDQEEVYSIPVKDGIQIQGDPVLYQSPSWTPAGIHNNENVFFLLFAHLYGNRFMRESGILRYTQQRMIKLHYSETWKNMFSYSEYGMASALTLRASYSGFILSLRQKGRGFNAKQVNDEKIIQNGGACFLGYRETNGSIFFDSPLDTREIFFMYMTGKKD